MSTLHFNTKLDKLIGKERPRFRKFKNIVLTYTPKATKTVEESIKDKFIEEFGDRFSKCLEPIEIKGTIYHKMAKSWSKKKREELNLKPFVSKPDLDNVIKLLSDSLNGVAYEDDKQVWKINLEQLYAKDNEIDLYITYNK